MELAVAFQAFDGGDLLAFASADRGAARPFRHAVDQYSTSAALAFAAAVFAAGEVEIVAEDAEQSALVQRRDTAFRAVDGQFSYGRHVGVPRDRFAPLYLAPGESPGAK